MYLSAYGLQISSNAIIPGLTPLVGSSEPDVKVWLQSMPRMANDSAPSASDLWYVSRYDDDGNEPSLKIWKLNDKGFFRIRYYDETEFFMTETGDEIWATWPDSLTIEDTATYLLGPILGFLLRLRGVTCLHASAIVVDGRAIALVGSAGAGKSTTAAAFTQQGYSVLSEDVVALCDQDGSFLVQPGYPLIRLWPESVRWLFGADDALPPLTPNWNKRYLDLTQDSVRFQPQPAPLSAVYLLDNRSEDPASPFIESPLTHDSLIALVANTYANSLLDREMRAREFDLLGRLVMSVPVRKLTPHSDPARLPELCRFILDDFRSLPSG